MSAYPAAMNKRVVVPLAEGVEEMEAVIVIDVLRRAGLEVVVAGLEGAGPVRASRGVVLHAELGWDEALEQPVDALVLPFEPIHASQQRGVLRREVVQRRHRLINTHRCTMLDRHGGGRPWTER